MELWQIALLVIALPFVVGTWAAVYAYIYRMVSLSSKDDDPTFLITNIFYAPFHLVVVVIYQTVKPLFWFLGKSLQAGGRLMAGGFRATFAFGVEIYNDFHKEEIARRETKKKKEERRRKRKLRVDKLKRAGSRR